jgi:hypothetical protein
MCFRQSVVVVAAAIQQPRRGHQFISLNLALNAVIDPAIMTGIAGDTR